MRMASLPARWRECERPYRVPGKTVRRQFQHGLGEAEECWVSCTTCEPCLARRRHDAVGRMIAESVYAEASFFSTHTIGGDPYYGSQRDNPKAQRLMYEDMQGFVKRLRYATHFDAMARHKEVGGKAGDFVAPKLRFFFVGEFGSLKGRPHYHMISFWKGARPPEVTIGGVVNHGKMHESVDLRYYGNEVGRHGRTYWPWGHSQWLEFEPKSAHYVSKYLTKTAEEREGRPAPFKVMAAGRSTMPMLGAPFFEDLARRYVEAQLPINDRSYRLPFWADAYQKEYWMNKTALMFTCRTYQREWMARHAADPGFPRFWPVSNIMDGFDRFEGKRLEKAEAEAIAREEKRHFLLEFRKARAKREQRDRELAAAHPVIRRIGMMFR